MCARFVTVARFTDIKAEFGVTGDPPEGTGTSYNVAPSSAIAAITRNGEKHFTLARWGLLPHWARDPRNPMINARAETIEHKKSFIGPLRNHRAIIPAEGFYEWKHGAGRKQPWYFHLRSGRPLGMAAIISPWEPRDGTKILTIAIITTNANRVVAPVHERMPAILTPEQAELWLSPVGADPSALKTLLGPLPDDLLEGYAVSTAVNSTGNDSPGNIEPID